MTLEVALPRLERERAVGVSLFDPEGREHYLGVLDAERPELRRTIGARTIEGGVWELAIWGRQANRGPVSAEVRAALLPLVSTASDRLELEHPAGHAPAGEIELTSSLDQTWRGHGEARVAGAVRRQSQTINAATWSTSVSLAAEEAGIDFELVLPPEDWRLFTDLAILIEDASGHALIQDAFTYRRRAFSFDRSDGAEPGESYTLKLLGGIADPDLAAPAWQVEIIETRRYQTPVTASVSQDGDHDLVLYPDHPATLGLDLDSTPPQPPAGFAWLLELTLEPTDQRQPGLAIAVEAH
jgi:hypothetical protein